jgi:hypothetical protein
MSSDPATGFVALASSSSSTSMGQVGKHDEEDSVASYQRLRTDQAPLKRVEREKLGQTFFFCDMRRAVIICNLVTIVVSMALLLIWSWTRPTAPIQDDDFHDDHVVNNVADGWSKLEDVSNVYHIVLRTICASLGVLGGIFFHFILVAISAVAVVFDFCASIIRRDWVGIFMPPIFLYPHLMFLKYLRSGLMSPENYKNEMQSCCGV